MKSFTKQSLTKRMLAIILSLLFAVSSFTIAGFVPTMDAKAAHEISKVDSFDKFKMVAQLLTSNGNVTKTQTSSFDNLSYNFTNNGVTWQDGTIDDYGYANFDGSSYLTYTYDKSTTSLFGKIVNDTRADNSTKNEPVSPFTISFMMKKNGTDEQSLWGFSSVSDSNLTVGSLTDSSTVVTSSNNSSRANVTTTGRWHFVSDWAHKFESTYTLGESATPDDGWDYYTYSYKPVHTDNSSGSLYIYKNGKQINTVTNTEMNQYSLDYFSSNAGAQSNNKFYIGASMFNYAKLNGKVRDFRIYEGYFHDSTNNGETSKIASALMENQKALAMDSKLVPSPAQNITLFDGASATGTTSTTIFEATDSTNNLTIKGAGWRNGQTNSYTKFSDSIRINDGTGSATTLLNKIYNDTWEISLKYQYQPASDVNLNATLFGIGSHNKVTATNDSSAQNDDGIRGNHYSADLIHLQSNGDIYLGDTKVQTIDTSKILSSDPKVLKFKYDNGNISLIVDDETLYSTTVTNVETYKRGPGNFFFGTSSQNYNGGANKLRYYGDLNNNNCLKMFSIYNISLNVIDKSAPIPDPEFTVPEAEYAPSQSDIDYINTKMTAFETKMSNASTSQYYNINNAYMAYVNCQRALDASVYGKDSSINLRTYADALDTATNAITTWNGAPKSSDYKSIAFSSNDSATENKSYFSGAIYLDTSNLLRCESSPDHANYKLYYPEGVYIYDGSTAIRIPLLWYIKAKNGHQINSGFFTNVTDGMTLRDSIWYGRDGGSDELSFYKAITQYGMPASRKIVISSSNDNSNNNWGLTSGWTYYMGNLFDVDASKVLGTNYYTKLSFGNFNVRSNTSGNWENQITPTGNVYVIDYVKLKEALKDNTSKITNVSSYKEGGMNDLAYYFNGIGAINYSSITLGNAVEYSTSIKNNVEGIKNNNATADSEAYKNLRKAISDSKTYYNDKCYSNWEEYEQARTLAINAMSALTAGITTSGKANLYNSTYASFTINEIANKLNTARTNLVAGAGEHLYTNTGIVDLDNKKIVYKCLRCPDDTTHADKIDASAYMSAADTLESEIRKVEKYTKDSRDTALDVLNDNALSDDGENVHNDSEVYIAHADAQSTIDFRATELLTALQSLQSRTNLNDVTITYCYFVNSEEAKKGKITSNPNSTDETDHLKYGDVITNSYYTLASNQHVVKWTAEYYSDAEHENKIGSTLNYTYNPTTNLNIEARNHVLLSCYIETDVEDDNDEIHTVQFIDKAGRVRAIAYAKSSDVFTVDSYKVLLNGKVVFTSDILPFYDAAGVTIGKNLIETGSTFTVSGDTNVYSAYKTKLEKIVININGKDKKLNGKAINDNKYEAAWDELISITADDDKSVFVWYIDGVPMSIGNNLTFRASETCRIETTNQWEYKTEFVTDYIGTTKVDYFNYDVDLNRVTCVVSFNSFGKKTVSGTNKEYFNNNENVVSAGVYLSTKASDQKTILETGKKFASNKFTSLNNQAKITVSRTAKTAFTMYAVPYVTINENGVEKTYYGDVKYTHYAGENA